MGWAGGLIGMLGKAGGKVFSKAATLGKVASTNAGSRSFLRGAGRVAANVGLQAGVGAAAAIATDNTDFIWTGAAMGAMGGAASIFSRGPSSAKLMWSKRMMAGQAIGAATGSPTAGPIAALGLTGARAFGPAMAKGAGMGTLHAPGYALNLARAPFAPRKALQYLARENYPMGAPLMLGIMGGAGWAGAKMMGGGRQRELTDSMFMGGMNYAAQGGRTMGFNHMETAGLTLAIHNRGRGNRVVL